MTIKAISKIELDQLNSDELNYFQKDEKLKDILSKKLQESYSKDKKQFDDIALWIIRDWGGIHSGSNSDKEKKETLELVNTFIDTKKIKFKRIASTSKVAGFMYPDKNIIYDSRVSYTVNWIILSLEIDLRFFPIPEGRNSKMKAFDLDVLIRLKNIKSYKCDDFKTTKKHISIIDKDFYIPDDDAYYEMNKLIHEVNEMLWDNKRKNEPFYTEMLLFSLADTIVYKEITDTISLNLK